MTTSGQAEILGDRQGIPFYGTNPSVPPRNDLQTRSRTIQTAKGGHAMIVNGTGEILGKTSVAFMDQEEVDPTRFVKIYLDGLRKVVGLSKAGLSLFEVVYMQLQSRPGEDKVALSGFIAKQSGIEDRTYRRGLRDLLEKEILYASPAPSLFFVNIRYLFNGNRLHFIKSYYLKGTAGKYQGQSELGFDD